MKKQILNILLPFLFTITSIAQTTYRNWVKIKTYRQPTTTAIETPTVEQANIKVTYYDGLGRPIQSINYAQSATGKDIVQHIAYDNFGRQTKEYLPYASDNATLDFYPNAESDTENFYSSNYGAPNPYSEKQLEASPLNRIQKQAAPGSDWAMGTNHEIKFDYQTNTANEVKLFKVTTSYNQTIDRYEPSFVDSGYYYANQLYKHITVDENTTGFNDARTEEFKNKKGQVVLKRIYARANQNATLETFDTFYVYDDFGNLTYVLPPLAEAQSNTINPQILDNLCYQYKYDSRNRVIAKKIPGKQWEYIVYDKLNRVRATGPAKSPFTNQSGEGWLITKYDNLNRPILTAWKPETVNESSRINFENEVTNASSLSEEKSTSNNSINTIVFRYTNTSYPTSNYHILSITYYDDYNYPNAPTIPSTILGQDVRDGLNGTTKTLATGSWLRILTNTNNTYAKQSYTLYKTDRQASVIATRTNYPNNGFTEVQSKINFEGKVEKTITHHKIDTNADLVATEENFSYTPQGRLLTHTEKVNDDPTENIATNQYNELGELITKKVGATTNNPIQKVDYKYNIRGWLTDINDVAGLTDDVDDLFAFKLKYQNTRGVPLYNGNISQAYWKTASDNLLRQYRYFYDDLNRLTVGRYKNSSLNILDTYNESLTYDKNGNIQTLHRNGGFESQTINQTIDNLEYTYAQNSNQLMKVVDLTNSSQGFKDDGNGTIASDPNDDYAYDANGNMIKDENKNITNITYNHLNLPTKIQFTNGRDITYIYDASGSKQKKIVNFGTQTATTNYMDGFQYEKKPVSMGGFGERRLQFFPTAEGYVKPVYSEVINIKDPEFQYVYNYTDHLGNIRLSYTKFRGITKTLEENNYYPFGLKPQNYNETKKTLKLKEADNSRFAPQVVASAYNYKYNGKELQDELGLNWYDYGARNYRADTGNWGVIDPLAEKYLSWSPYNYVMNNPIKFVDSDGMSVDDVIIKGKYSKEAFTQLQASVKNQLTLSMNDKGLVSAVVNDGVILKDGGAAQTLLNATKSTGIDVNINTSSGFKTSDGYDFVGGAFGGSFTNNDGVVVANQTVNPKVQKILDMAFERGYGTGILHEVLEAYVGAIYTPNSPAGTTDNSVGKANYDKAHNKAVEIDPRYNKTGKIGPTETHSVNNGKGSLIRTRYYNATKKNGEIVPLGSRKLKPIKLN